MKKRHNNDTNGAILITCKWWFSSDHFNEARQFGGLFLCKKGDLVNALIVGAGLYGATIARKLAEQGHQVLVIDARNEVGGNAATKDCGGIMVHEYGAHIFHTNDDEVWSFVSRFGKFNDYVHKVVAINNGVRYVLPFNLDTFGRLWGLNNDQAILARLEYERMKNNTVGADTLEGAAISQIGRHAYETLVEGYTAKQWGVDPATLPASIIRRIPVRDNHDDRYFGDKHQGIPVDGYTELTRKMLDHKNIRIKLSKKLKHLSWAEHRFDAVIYTGSVDELFKYKLGVLEYRSLRFENEDIPIQKFQKVAVENYTSEDVEWTRIIEHKLFSTAHRSVQPEHTVITREFPTSWEKGKERYYPVSGETNKKVYAEYKKMVEAEHPKLWLGGRLGSYRYLNMDQVIRSAIDDAKQIGDRTDEG